MFCCRRALRTAGKLVPSAILARRTPALFSVSAAHSCLGVEEYAIADDAPPAPTSLWTGVVSEMMKDPFLMHTDFCDFYNYLLDRSLSAEEMDRGRAIFCTGVRGPIFARAWLYASLQACTCLDHRTMGHSFISYFRANRDVRSAGNYIAALRFLSDIEEDHPQMYEVLEQMRGEMDEDEWFICRKDLKSLFSRLGDWRTVLSIGLTVPENEKTLWFEDALCVCIALRDLASAQEVVSEFQDANVSLTPRVLEIALSSFECSPMTPDSTVNLYLSFIDLILKEMSRVGSPEFSFEFANTLGQWFMDIPSRKWKAVTHCSTSSKGLCSACRAPLDRFQPTEENLQAMLTELRDRTFSKERKLYTSERLFRQFERFLRSTPPFDLVVDIENIVRVHSVKTKPHIFFSFLRTLFTHYQPMNVLFVGKYINENGAMFNFIRKVFPKVRLFTFQVDSIFKDDAFLLHAAVTYNCYVLSNDAFRDHMALLPPESKLLWKRWKAYRQIAIASDGTVIHPVDSLAEISGSIDSGRLHLPHYISAETLTQAEKHEFLCLRRLNRPRPMRLSELN